MELIGGDGVGEGREAVVKVMYGAVPVPVPVLPRRVPVSQMRA